MIIIFPFHINRRKSMMKWFVHNNVLTQDRVIGSPTFMGLNIFNVETKFRKLGTVY